MECIHVACRLTTIDCHLTTLISFILSSNVATLLSVKKAECSLFSPEVLAWQSPKRQCLKTVRACPLLDCTYMYVIFSQRETKGKPQFTREGNESTISGKTIYTKWVLLLISYLALSMFVSGLRSVRHRKPSFPQFSLGNMSYLSNLYTPFELCESLLLSDR